MKEKKPALLFFDADGTLIDEEKHAVPISASDAVRKARENGHLAFLNTGRPYKQTAKDVFAIGFDGFLCACGMYISIGNEVIEDVRLDPQYCRNIRDTARNIGLQMIYESYDAWFYDAAHSDLLWSTQEMETVIKTEARTFDSIDVPEFRFEKFLVMKTSCADWPSFRDSISADYSIMDRGSFYECVPKGHTKATAIQKVLAYLKMEDAETYAFGDSANDVAMLDAVKHPVIMGSAPDSLKKGKYYVTGSAGENGIASALRHFHII
ncbi:MAG: HAD hydrolase family protein [Clostridiales bacterium]|nr:HAD hydrolase family protein [Clostridiales bacterium]